MNLSGFLNPIPQSIQFLGSFILVFFIILFNLIIFKLIINKGKVKIIYYFILIILISNFFLFTNLNLNQNENDNTIKVAGIQGNLNQDWLERYNNYINNSNKYIKLSELAIKKHSPEIIIWPEYTFTHPIEFDFYLQKKLTNFSKNNNITLIVGSILLENVSSNKSKRYDSLYIFDKGEIKNYNAYEPVIIFDEEAIKTKKNLPVIINNKSLTLSLCYEENFPHIYTKGIKEHNSQALFTIGNQFSIKSKHALELISLNSKLRAAENNRYLFRLETTGLSVVFDNNGKKIKEVPIRNEEILYYELPLIEEKTFYSKYGKNMEYIFSIFSLILIIYSIKNNKD